MSDHYERLAQRNVFSELIALRDQQREHRRDGIALLDGDKLPWELNEQGYMRWYMSPTIDGLVISTYQLYVQRIPARSRSGQQKLQGGQLGFVWQGGPGHTVVDGVDHHWDEWSLVQIPLRVKGCVVQHFNDSDADVDIIFTSLNLAHAISVDRGVGFEQLEVAPEFAAREQDQGRP